VTDNLDKLYSLKKKIEEMQREVHKAEGALSQAMEQLEKKFGCATKEDAEELLQVWKKRSASSSKKFEKAYKKFKEEYPDLFSGDSE